MEKRIEEIIQQTAFELIQSAKEKERLEELKRRHKEKIHIIPIKYRVFGGALQSLNIRFGNFIEVLMAKIIEEEDKYEIINKFSTNDKLKLSINQDVRNQIDDFIANNTKGNFSEINLRIGFEKLIDEIYIGQAKRGAVLESWSKDVDVDVLFKDKEKDTYYYMEIKYNDDHDTGKFENINSKFLKTYAGLIRELDVATREKITPILFYFNNHKKVANPHIPENYIFRGQRFFDSFLTTSYEELDSYIENVSEEKEIIKLFDNLYKEIVNP